MEAQFEEVENIENWETNNPEYNIEKWAGINKLAFGYQEKKIEDKVIKVYLLFLGEIINDIAKSRKMLKGDEVTVTKDYVFGFKDQENNLGHSEIWLEKINSLENSVANIQKVKNYLLSLLSSEINVEDAKSIKTKIETLTSFLTSKIQLLYKSQEKPATASGQKDTGFLVEAWLNNGGLTEILPLEMALEEFDWGQNKKNKKDFNPFKQKAMLKEHAKHPILTKYIESGSNKAPRETITDLIKTELEEIISSLKKPKEKGILARNDVFGKTLGIRITAKENDIFDRLPLHLLDIETVIKSRGDGKLTDPLFIKTKWTAEKFNHLKEVFTTEIASILFNLDPNTGYFSYKLGQKNYNLSEGDKAKLEAVSIHNHFDIIGKIMGFKKINYDKTNEQKKEKKPKQKISKEIVLDNFTKESTSPQSKRLSGTSPLWKLL